MDVFSRYLWLVPLSTKSSRDIARELKKIYEWDGPPDRLQSDQGLEFHGCVENICKKYKIRRIRSRPYHPQLNRKARLNVRTDDCVTKWCMTCSPWRGEESTGQKTCQATAECLTKKRKKELGWLSPFEVYYGRKSNIVAKASLENYDIDSCPSESLKNPKGKTYLNTIWPSKTLGKEPSLTTESWKNRWWTSTCVATVLQQSINQTKYWKYCWDLGHGKGGLLQNEGTFWKAG